MAAARYQQAYDLAGEAIANAAGARYDDASDLLNWLHDDRSRAARALGRWDDAVRELEEGRRIPERGNPNVSQSINLGVLDCSLDRPRDALRAIADLGLEDVNGYGRMILARIRHEASVELGDRAAARSEMDWMREHQSDSESTFLEALVMSGEFDEGVRVFDALLASRARTRALLGIQGFLWTPATARMEALRRQWELFLARPDVARTVAAIGKVEHFNLPDRGP
jgi:beta-barrel assembly-enhancing protease